MNPSINPYVSKPIRSIQESLRRIAQSEGSIPPVIPDGVFGEQTRAAVLAFQENRGLPTTGRIDLVTWEAITARHREIVKAENPPRPAGLYPSADFTIQVGESNVHLFSITGVLAGLAARFPQLGHVDQGDTYTVLTQGVVKNLQASFGVAEDGVITKAFWDLIGSLYEAAVASLPFGFQQEGEPEEGTGIGM